MDLTMAVYPKQHPLKPLDEVPHQILFSAVFSALFSLSSMLSSLLSDQSQAFACLGNSVPVPCFLGCPSEQEWCLKQVAACHIS